MKQTEALSVEDKLASFDGGLTLVGHKHLSTGSAISRLEQSKLYTVPLQQHIGAISQPLVKVGDRVLKGQMLARPGDLVDPVSGNVLEAGALKAVGITGTGVIAMISQGLKSRLISIQAPPKTRMWRGPTAIAPAALMRETIRESAAGRWPA